MLAKELKIKNLMQQRAFITERIKKRFESLDGATSAIYVGQLFEENIAYFKHEGFKIISIEPGVVLEAKYQPVHIFLIDENNLNLSADEMDEMSNTEIRKAPEDTSKEEIENLFNSLISELSKEHEYYR